MRSSRILLGLLLAAVVSLCIGAAEYNPVRKQPAAASASTGRVIVKLSASDTSGRAQAQSASNTVAALAGRNKLTLKQTRQITSNLHVMQFEPETSGESLDESLARLRADSAVEYAEADHRRFANAVPNDELYTGQWYMQNASSTPSAIDAETAWDVTTGSSSVVIADLDTGVLFDHPDLLRMASGGRLLAGYDFISDTDVANDGDGRDSDSEDPGDWITSEEANSSTFSDCDVSDSSWHGTRVAGILGALSNNSTGIAGVTWSGSILPVRVLGKCGGYDSDILAAMLWAGGIHVDGVEDNANPAKIENLSFGSTGTTCPASYEDVIDQLTEAGVLVVVSAGNEGGPVAVPARCDGVAAIAGLRHTGTKVGFSSLGREIALSAPGGNCVNTAEGEPCLYSIDTTYNLGTTTATTHSYTDQTNYNVGTSFSAPIVSGIAGLMASVNGNLNSSQLIARLQEGTTTFPVSSDSTVAECHVPTSSNDLQTSECNCTTETCGAGMADANGAVQAALRPIAAVTTPESVSAGQSIALSGEGSTAADTYTIASYAWTVACGSVSITDSNTATATVVAPSSGSYTVRLTVTDNADREDTVDVVVTSSTATTAASTDTCGSTDAEAIEVSVSPSSASVAEGGTQSFTATVTNSSNTEVTWKVNNVAGGNSTVGTISTAGVYTAPASVPSPATVTVTAVSTADTSRSDSAEVTITEVVAVSESNNSSSGGGGAVNPSALIALAAVLMLRRRRVIRAGAGRLR